MSLKIRGAVICQGCGETQGVFLSRVQQQHIGTDWDLIVDDLPEGWTANGDFHWCPECKG